MGNGMFFENMKRKVQALYNNFFYEAQEAPAPRQEESYPPESAAPQPVYQQAQPGYAPYQQGVYQQPQNYPPQQAAYQQQPQAEYQPAYQQPQAAAPQRNRRAQHHAGQENNVVDFGAYQQQSAAYQQPQNYPPQQANYAPQQAAQQPSQVFQPEQPQQGAGAQNARIINARGMGDCRSAITLLRNGDAVLIVLENITDPAEMRRLVDTLSGACYSLTATITKVSRYGVYLLAPQAMAVYADQITNQMNGAPGRARTYQPGARAYQPQQGYQSQGAYQQPQAAQPAYQQPQQGGFTQRAAAPEESAQPFYSRTAPQAAPAPAFSAQPAASGYTPDEYVAVDQ